VAGRRAAIEASGTQVAFVHMASDEQAREVFDEFRLGDVPRVSDPSCTLYRAFGLERGRLTQIAGPSVWLRGAAAILKSGVRLPVGDTLQMPGVFLVFRGEIVVAFRHEHTSDVPDYLALATCSLPHRHDSQSGS
jgi:hypothetical protein